jgi:hypothetical protein
VRQGDRLDDREPEAAARARASVASATEPLEGPGQERRRKATSVIPDVKLDHVASRNRGQRDRTSAVAERVVDQVGESLTDADGVADELEPGRRLGRQRSALLVRTAGEPFDDAAEQLVGVDRCDADRQRPLI